MQLIPVRRKQEEFPPETLRGVQILCILMLRAVLVLQLNVFSCSYFEEVLIELHNLRLEGLRSTLLGQG
jgi:hypothetical protein